MIGGRPGPVPHMAPAAPHGTVNSSMESVAASGAVSASLETTSAAPAVTPRYWMEGGYGHNTARWQRTTDSYAGRWAQRLTIDWTLVAAAAVAGLTVAARAAQRRWPRSRRGDNPVPAEGKRVSSSSSSRLRTA